MSERGDMEHPLGLDDASSSDGQANMRNRIHVEDCVGSIRDIKNDYTLRELEAEGRKQEINENEMMMFEAEPHKVQGGSEMQNMQQQNVIEDLLAQMTQVQSPYSAFSDKRPTVVFPADPVLNQHLRSVEMSQQSRQAPASSSSNNPESAHEPKGRAGRPRNDHGAPTETRTDPLWWQSQPVGFIQIQLSNRGRRKPHFQHFTQKRGTCQTINKRTLFKIISF